VVPVGGLLLASVPCLAWRSSPLTTFFRHKKTLTNWLGFKSGTSRRTWTATPEGNGFWICV